MFDFRSIFGRIIKHVDFCGMKKPLLPVLSPTQLGERLAHVRKKQGLTQAQFAESLGMPRLALTQVELGNRSLKLEELARLAPHLPGTLNQFLDPSSSFLEGHNPYSRYQKGSSADLKEPVLEFEVVQRNPVPVLSSAKLDQVLKYFVHHAENARDGDYSLLGLLVYFSEFQHYEQYEFHFCGLNFVKVPHGFVVADVASALDELAMEMGGKMLGRDALGKPDLRSFNGAELEILQGVCSRYGQFDSHNLRLLVQRDIPWLATADGEEVDYELAMYREFPFSVNWFEQSEANAL